MIWDVITNLFLLFTVQLTVVEGVVARKPGRCSKIFTCEENEPIANCTAKCDSYGEPTKPYVYNNVCTCFYKCDSPPLGQLCQLVFGRCSPDQIFCDSNCVATVGADSAGYCLRNLCVCQFLCSRSWVVIVSDFIFKLNQ